MRRFVLVFTLCLLMLSGCAAPSAQVPDEPESITLAMGFVPNVQFTPVYVALERGYFAEQGIDLNLDYGMETDILQRLAQEDVAFAIASGDQVILARANDLSVRCIYNWYQRFPVTIVSLASSGIDSPEALDGKTVGIPVTYGASYIGWLALAQELGFDESDVNLQVIGYNQVASLTEHRVDAAVCYTMNEPVQLASLGHEINTFDLKAYTTLPSNGLVASESMIEQSPDLARRMIEAFDHGLQDTLDDPDAAFAITRQAIPEMDDETAVLQRQVLDACLEIWETDTPGAYDAAAWEQSVVLMQELGVLAKPIDSALAFTNDMLP